MKTLSQNTREVGPSAYWGQLGEWLIADAQTRDSDCLSRSNFRCFKKALMELEADFRGLADMLGCVRGKYFAGYASELLN